jgi:hypothetical protein
MGPQAMEGDLKVSPGTTLQAGYDFTVPGNHASFSLTVSNPQMVFAVRCVCGATPSASTFTVTMPTQTYAVTTDQWYPSGDQHSPLCTRARSLSRTCAAAGSCGSPSLPVGSVGGGA